jgi:uncharacterized protein involved in propanediol utilization
MGRTDTPTMVPYRKSQFRNGGAQQEVNISVVGHCPAHHGEFLQGKFISAGQLIRGLVTVPFEGCYSQACFHVNSRSRKLIISPADRTKALIAAKLTLRACGIKRIGGHLEVRSNIPMKLGMGSSTADVVATIIAVARACKVELPPEVIARIAVLAEKASDSTMFGDRAVLMAHREGSVIEYLSGPLPHLTILGTNTDASGVGVDTLAFPPAEYNYKEVMEFEVLRALMRRAIATQSAALLGKVSSASARINQTYLPKPKFDRIERIIDSVGALGLQAAHSGTIVGLIFDPKDPLVPERLHLARVRLSELGLSQAWEFEVSNRLREVAA